MPELKVYRVYRKVSETIMTKLKTFTVKLEGNSSVVTSNDPSVEVQRSP